MGTTGTLLVSLPPLKECHSCCLSWRFSGLVFNELVFSSVALYLTYCDIWCFVQWLQSYEQQQQIPGPHVSACPSVHDVCSAGCCLPPSQGMSNAYGPVFTGPVRAQRGFPVVSKREMKTRVLVYSICNFNYVFKLLIDYLLYTLFLFVMDPGRVGYMCVCMV